MYDNLEFPAFIKMVPYIFSSYIVVNQSIYTIYETRQTNLEKKII